MPTTNVPALTAYLLAQIEAHALRETLTQQLDAHQECASHDRITWGHVGDITAMIAQLKNLVQP